MKQDALSSKRTVKYIVDENGVVVVVVECRLVVVLCSEKERI